MGRVTHRDTQMMMAHLLSQRENVAKHWVTVTAGQTYTINLLGIASGKSAVVTWGDGLSNEYTGSATRTHVYASAGTYAVKIYTPENVITFDLRDGAAVSVLNSDDLKGMVNVSNFTLFNITSATITIAPSTIKNWATITNIDIRSGNLTQPQCDLVLWECYQITRTRTGGAIKLAIAGNAAPSGTFQPCQSPPVSSSTPGKEIAYELLNDSLDVGFNKWADVSTN